MDLEGRVAKRLEQKLIVPVFVPGSRVAPNLDGFRRPLVDGAGGPTYMLTMSDLR